MGNNFFLEKTFEIDSIDLVVKKNNPNLINYFAKHKSPNNIITPEEFCKIIKNKDKDFGTELFYVFSRSKTKMTFHDFKIFFTAFMSKFFEHKIGVITEIVFGKKPEIDKDEYGKRISLFLEDDILNVKFQESSFVEKIKYKNKLSKKKFSEVCKVRYGDFFKKFSFIKQISFSSKKEKDSLNWICNCKSEEFFQQEQRSFTDLDNKYEKMRKKFFQLTSHSNYLLQLTQLNLIFQELNVDESIILFVLVYLKKISGQGFITFEIFKNFIKNFDKSIPLEQKDRFLFKILTYPEKEVPIKDFKKKLQIEISDISSDVINYDAFERSEQILERKVIFFDSFDKISYIPYFFFDLPTNDLLIKKRTFQFVIHDIDPVKYLQNNFDKEKSFCLIRVDDWNTVMSRDDDKVFRYFDNTKLIKNDFFIYPHLKINEDFYIIPNTLYKKIHSYYQVRPKITVDKLKLEEKTLYDKVFIDTKNGFVLKDNYCLDVYLVRFLRISLTRIIEVTSQNEGTISKEAIEKCIKKNIFDLKEEVLTKTEVANRKQSIKEIAHNQNNTDIRFKIFYNNQFLECNEKSTIEELNIKEFFLLVIDTRNSQGIFYSELIGDKRNNLRSYAPISNIGGKKKIKEEYDDEVVHIHRSSTNVVKSKDNKEKLEEYTKEKTERKTVKSQSATRDEQTEEASTTESLCSMNKTTIEKEDGKSKLMGLFSFTKPKPLSLPYGIRNLGNTCYFNSVIQIFLNLPPLQKIFLSDNIKLYINKKDNKKGKLLNLFLKLFHETKGTLLHSVKNFRSALGKIAPDFGRNIQQDANEFFIFLLEKLHEEINIKSGTKWIQNKDFYQNITEDELSGICWANSMRQSCSFLYSLFQFQLKSVLCCEHCQKTKVSFEQIHSIDLPISLGRMIKVDIMLYRLPFKYKLYYSTINEEFRKYCEENKDKDMSTNLANYSYTFNKTEVDEYKIPIDSSIPLNLSIDIERKETIGKIIEIIRKIKELDLEKYCLVQSDEDDDDPLKKSYLKNFTSFVVTSKNGKLLSNNSKISDYLESNDAISFCVYELLNSRGLNSLLEKEESLSEINLMIYKNININLIEEVRKSKKKYGQNDIISVEDQLEERKNSISFQEMFKTEFILKVVHYSIAFITPFLFQNFRLTKRSNFPNQYIIVNNTKICNYVPIMLYEYIFELNKQYINISEINNSQIWWRNKDSKLLKCYPFVLRRIVSKSYGPKCSLCPWYNFCIGCIIDPFSSKYLKFGPDEIICVDWCIKVFENDKHGRLYFNVDYDKIRCFLEEQAIQKEITLKDCFDLFFIKEKLEDKLYCKNCKSHQYFFKHYEISRLPHALVISLKRFKYTLHSRSKLSHRVIFPIEGMTLKDKTYDLFGIINHYGNISEGHYTVNIRPQMDKNKWITINDDNISEISEKSLITKNAYILIYLSRDDFENTNSYYLVLKSLTEKLNNNIKFYESEPVSTEYGNGYVIKDYSNEDEKNFCGVNIQFEFGSGFIHPSHITRETKLNK